MEFACRRATHRTLRRFNCLPKRVERRIASLVVPASRRSQHKTNQVTLSVKRGATTTVSPAQPKAVKAEELLYECNKNHTFKLTTVFCGINTFFWITSTGYFMEIFGDGFLAQNVFPAVIVFGVGLSWIARWAYGRHYISSLVLEEGWTSLRYSTYNFWGPNKLNKKIEISEISPKLTGEHYEQYHLRVNDDWMPLVIDKSKGFYYDEDKIRTIIQRKSLLQNSVKKFTKKNADGKDDSELIRDIAMMAKKEKEHAEQMMKEKEKKNTTKKV